jgi:hypothetical protein
MPAVQDLWTRTWNMASNAVEDLFPTAHWAPDSTDQEQRNMAAGAAAQRTEAQNPQGASVNDLFFNGMMNSRIPNGYVYGKIYPQSMPNGGRT